MRRGVDIAQVRRQCGVERGGGLGRRGEVHNGADDNASGTAVLAALARSLTVDRARLRRSVLLAAFSGEELGLLGSAHYVKHPVVPLDKTVAMVNMDMLGALRRNGLLVGGAGTSQAFGELLSSQNTVFDFRFKLSAGGLAQSDHAVFNAKKIPVLFLFTGTHKRYHRPTDDADTLNYPGLERVARFAHGLVRALARMDQAPAYVAVPSSAGRHGGIKVRLGLI
ncbi:MAG: M28 family peptidase, partial [Proteobacteria bacterium]|nr:M28 family peptidase [Pseudomonadota bacterium]